MVDAGIWQLFRLYRSYETGALLIAGGLMNQPAAYNETMEYIHQVKTNG